MTHRSHPADHDQLAIALGVLDRDLAEIDTDALTPDDRERIIDTRRDLAHLAQLCADRAVVRRVVAHDPARQIHGFGA